jgi:hypothetical protein
MSTYISTPPNHANGFHDPGHSWEEHAERRLAWVYGPARAEAVMAGRDPATNADIAAWTGLGEGRAAA